MLQTSCSELLVDTRIHDPEEAFRIFSHIFEMLGWECSPKLSVTMLDRLMTEAKESAARGYEENYSEEKEGTRIRATVYNAFGESTALEYGDNGYITTGFRFDSECNDYDQTCYPIFEGALENIPRAKLIACDGGGTAGYEEWFEKTGGVIGTIKNEIKDKVI